MSLWKKLFRQETDAVDYYDEGLALLNAGKYHEALTSFRLAQRDAPEDAAVLQQIAVTYTRIGMTDEAIRAYRKALSSDATAAGAHYGLAFLLLREGRPDDAASHLREFLAQPPAGPEAERHVEHAKQTLAQLDAGLVGSDDAEGAIP